MGCCFGIDSNDPSYSNPNQIDQSHFSFIKTIGTGSLCRVDVSKNKRTGQLFAVKKIPKSQIFSKEARVQMIWSERNIMCQLYNPFCIHLEHAFQDSNNIFFVLPFMIGGDLRFHLKKQGKFPETAVKFFAAQMVLALDHLHKLAIVHRDIKPANILIDEKGYCKLSDFSVACQLNETSDYHVKGTVGSTGYMSPEVVSGHSYNCSPDSWSLGITLYELLHGRRPFKQWDRTCDWTGTGRIKFDAGISSKCKDFVLRCLEVDVQSRMGCGVIGWAEAMAHAWFSRSEWQAHMKKLIKSPLQIDQTGTFNYSLQLHQLVQAEESENLGLWKIKLSDQKYQEKFKGFEYNIDIHTNNSNRHISNQKSRHKLKQNNTNKNEITANQYLYVNNPNLNGKDKGNVLEENSHSPAAGRENHTHSKSPSPILQNHSLAEINSNTNNFQDLPHPPHTPHTPHTHHVDLDTAGISLLGHRSNQNLNVNLNLNINLNDSSVGGAHILNELTPIHKPKGIILTENNHEDRNKNTSINNRKSSGNSNSVPFASIPLSLPFSPKSQPNQNHPKHHSLTVLHPLPVPVSVPSSVVLPLSTSLNNPSVPLAPATAHQDNPLTTKFSPQPNVFSVLNLHPPFNQSSSSFSHQTVNLIQTSLEPSSNSNHKVLDELLNSTNTTGPIHSNPLPTNYRVVKQTHTINHQIISYYYDQNVSDGENHAIPPNSNNLSFSSTTSALSLPLAPTPAAAPATVPTPVPETFISSASALAPRTPNTDSRQIEIESSPIPNQPLSYIYQNEQ